MVPDIETRQLTNFLAVAERGSFRRAAFSMDIGQSSVSRRIQRLEDTLGVSLFERRTDGARLTVAGTCFATRARTILDELRAATETAQTAGSGGNGHFAIGVIVSLSRGALRHILSEYMAAHRQVDIVLVESDRSDLLSRLSHRHIDIVAAAGEPHANGGDGIVLSRERVFLATAADAEFAQRSQLHWEDLRGNTPDFAGAWS
ncbi:MAG: LysR family transcriptional regulator [Pseudomonadota bacterium]